MTRARRAGSRFCLLLLVWLGVFAFAGCRTSVFEPPAFVVRSKNPPEAPDHDLDGLSDSFENEIAERFRPVLHKHGADRQKGLYSIDLLLDGRADLRVERRETIFDPPMPGKRAGGGISFDKPEKPRILAVVARSKKWRLSAAPAGRPADLRKAGVETGMDAIRRDDGIGTVYCPFRWDYDSFRRSDLDPDEWLIDIDDALTFGCHAGAPEGRRPLYYHLYPEAGRLYLQYWYFFTMNDNRAESTNHVWHEGDWEHVAIELVESGGAYVPRSVDFYVHQCGFVRAAEDCWWSETPRTTYEGLKKGFDTRHTHLHIWLAANAHGSYNRYEPVYDLEVRAFFGTQLERWTDNLDYDPSGRDEYFPYDVLDNMGEAEERNGIVLPKGSSPSWIAFQGRFGEYWQSPFVATPSPGPLASREAFYSFHELKEGGRWGPRTRNHVLYRFILSWTPDRPDGD